MKKRFIVLNLLAAGLMSIAPFSIYCAVTLCSKNIYTNTYYAALVDKVHLLKSKQSKKIVLIGGSNVAFGFDGETLKEYFPDYEVVNFGLYASLGTKIMLDLAKPCLNDGDIALIAPEINEQSMSLYFSGKNTWKAIEEEKSLYWAFPNDNRDVLRGSYFEFNFEKSKYDEPIVPEGVYQRSSFNQYGDIHYGEEVEGEWISKRQSNILSLHYDPSMLINYDMEINSQFISYLNDYAYDLSKKGCQVLYSFSPVNSLSVEESPSYNAFYWSIRDNLKMPIVGNPKEYVLDSHYFYDSNFHLNDAGAILRSLIFVEQYYRDVKGEYVDLKDKYPDIPEYEEVDVDTTYNSETADCFIYQSQGETLEIVGVNEIGEAFDEITLPSVAEHTVVSGIASQAFANSNLKTVVVPPTIRYIKDGAFKDSRINRVYMESTHPSSINISWNGGLVEGTVSDFLIYVPEKAFSAYNADYYWGPYGQYLRKY